MQRLSGGAWTSVVKSILSVKSTYTIGWKPTTLTDYSFRIYVPTITGLNAGFSISKKLTVN